MGSQAWSLSPQLPGRAAGGAWLWNMWNPLVILHSYGKLPRESWFIVDLLFFLNNCDFQTNDFKSVFFIWIFFRWMLRGDPFNLDLLMLCSYHHSVIQELWNLPGSIIAYLICSCGFSIFQCHEIGGWGCPVLPKVFGVKKGFKKPGEAVRNQAWTLRRYLFCNSNFI